MESKNLNKIVFILGFLAFWVNGDNYAAAPLLLDIAKDLNISFENAALSVTSYMLFFGFLTILFGPLGDRFGKSKIIKVAAFGTAIFSMLGAFAYDLSSIVIIRAINGTFAAGILPISVAYAGENISEPEKKQNAIGKIMGMMFLGGALATIISGLLTSIGSWRLLYMFYGVAELLLTFVLIISLKDDSVKKNKLTFYSVYKDALANKSLMKVISVLFLMGFSVLGSFTYTGKLVQSVTNFSILQIGFILSFFGFGTIVGAKGAGLIRNKLGANSLVFAGITGALSLGLLSYTHNIFLLVASLFGFGFAFILLQSTLIITAQESMPNLRGTVMSIASFNMVVSGGIGTFINGLILQYHSISIIYIISSILVVIAGILSNRVVRKSDYKHFEQISFAKY